MTPEEEAQWLADRKAGLPITDLAPMSLIRTALLRLLNERWRTVGEYALELGYTRQNVWYQLERLVSEGMAEKGTSIGAGLSYLRGRPAAVYRRAL
jgi:predicted ArsR family transcriptional regulator